MGPRPVLPVMSEQIRIEDDGDSAIVTATGELDAYLAPRLSAAFEQTERARRLVVDLGHVSFLDSTALGIVSKAIRDRAPDRDGSGGVRVVLPRGSARRIFEITTLDRVLPVATSREDALAQLS